MTFKTYFLVVFQALQHNFFDFETFDVDEYEHYEVKQSVRLYTTTRVKYIYILVLFF